MRRSASYNISLFYGHYLEQFPSLRELIIDGVKVERHKLAFQEFVEIFRMALQFNGMEILNFLDKEFNIEKIEDDNGNLIYIN